MLLFGCSLLKYVFKFYIAFVVFALQQKHDKKYGIFM